MRYNSRTHTGRESSDVPRWPTERSRNWVRWLLDFARADTNILAAVAIGSAVRANVPSADLDLIVICGKPGNLAVNPPLEVDLRAFSEADIDGRIGSGHDLLGWAVKFGRVLFQRNHYWDRVVDSWQCRLPLPSAALSRKRAVSAHRRLVGVLELVDDNAAQEQAISYLTHLARAELLDRGVYPASRPELASQLRAIGSPLIADWLDDFLHNDSPQMPRMDELLKLSA